MGKQSGKQAGPKKWVLLRDEPDTGAIPFAMVECDSQSKGNDFYHCGVEDSKGGRFAGLIDTDEALRIFQPKDSFSDWTHDLPVHYLKRGDDDRYFLFIQSDDTAGEIVPAHQLKKHTTSDSVKSAIDCCAKYSNPQELTATIMSEVSSGKYSVEGDKYFYKVGAKGEAVPKYYVDISECRIIDPLSGTMSQPGDEDWSKLTRQLYTSLETTNTFDDVPFDYVDSVLDSMDDDIEDLPF